MTSCSERLNLPNTRTPSYMPEAWGKWHICFQPDEVYGEDCQSHVSTWRIACAVTQVDRGQRSILNCCPVDHERRYSGVCGRMRRNPKRNEKDASRTTSAGSGDHAGNTGLWRTRRADALAQRVPPRVLVPVLRFALHSNDGQLILIYGMMRNTSGLAADVVDSSLFPPRPSKNVLCMKRFCE
jgi:hypothetical protein